MRPCVETVMLCCPNDAGLEGEGDCELKPASRSLFIGEGGINSGERWCDEGGGTTVGLVVCATDTEG